MIKLSCLSVCLSVVNFIIRYNFWTARDRERLHIWHAYSTNDAFSNDTKVNDLVTLTLTFKLKIAFSDSVAAGGKVFHKHTLFFMYLFFVGLIFTEFATP